MNILWLSWKDREHPLAGGAEVVAHELGKRLVAGGHKLTFVTAGFKGASASTEIDSYQVIRVGGRLTVYLAAWRWYRSNGLNADGTSKYDLVIDECNTLPFMATFYARTRTIIFFHMLCRVIWFYELPKPLAAIGYVLEPVYLRMLSKLPVITVSNSTRQDLMRHGFKADKISIISEGTELEPAADIDAIVKFDQPTMLSLGSIRPMKRTLDQVKAFEIVKSKVPNLKLIIAGSPEGKYGQMVADYAKASRYAADIQILGRVTREQKLELMQKAHLITVTSIKEGWGLIVTEAAGQGTPAVVYDVDGLRDSVRKNETGIIATQNTPDGLAAGIASLLSDQSKYAQLRQAGYDWAKTLTFNQAYQDFESVINVK